jgi:hypothetical protein
VRVIPLLLLLITVAAGAIIVLAFLNWVDFGVTEINGTEADAATGISDGWFVAGLGAAIAVLAGGVLFRASIAPFLLPMIAVAAVLVLAIAGWDTITNWNAAGVNPDNPGILVQSDGDPTVVPYLISALAILIAVSAAVVRGIELSRDPRLFGSAAADEYDQVARTDASE